jgi:hypothetical protein
MANPKDLLGFSNAPKVGSRYDNDCGCNSSDDSRHQAKSLPLKPMERIQDDGNFLNYRASGVYSLIPGRALSAQTRMKNELYELPADKWTDNLEGPPWVVRVPGIPTKVALLTTVNDFTIQQPFMSPVANLQMQNETNWFGRLRAAVLGHFQSQQNTADQNLAVMFPSIYNNGE